MLARACCFERRCLWILNTDEVLPHHDQNRPARCGAQGLFVPTKSRTCHTAPFTGLALYRATGSVVGSSPSRVGPRPHLRLEIHLENTLPGPVVIAEDPVSCVAGCGRLSRNNDDAVATEDAVQKRVD
jgi:hypothetical protein